MAAARQPEIKNDLYKNKVWLYEKYYDQKLSMKQIAEFCNVHECTVRFWMDKYKLKRRGHKEKITPSINKRLTEQRKGKPTWNSGLKGNYQKWTKRGKEAPGYKGGISNASRNGYYKKLISEHPYADANGYVFVHRLVCEELLGRYLTEEEIVHHRDGNPKNNDPGNLFIFYGHATHREFHAKKNTFPDMSEEEFCKGVDYEW